LSEQKVINFPELTGNIIKPSLTVVGISRLCDFNAVEQEVCWALRRDMPTSAYALQNENRIAKRRIDNFFKFHGSLRHGQVVFAEFSPERAALHNSHLSIFPEPSTKELMGLTVFYMGMARSSRAGRLGYFCLETTYFKVQWGASDTDIRDHLNRTVGKSHELSELSAATANQKELSIEVALSLSKIALNHVYSGGAPGLGRKS